MILKMSMYATTQSMHIDMDMTMSDPADVPCIGVCRQATSKGLIPRKADGAMVKVGINGFGRIGRLTFRFAVDMAELEVVHINEIVGGSETAA